MISVMFGGVPLGLSLGLFLDLCFTLTLIIWLLLCSNHKDDVEWQIHAREGKDSVGRRVWVTSSSDLGKSWARPKEITSAVKHPSWTWYATGPGFVFKQIANVGQMCSATDFLIKRQFDNAGKSK